MAPYTYTLHIHSGAFIGAFINSPDRSVVRSRDVRPYQVSIIPRGHHHHQQQHRRFVVQLEVIGTENKIHKLSLRRRIFALPMMTMKWSKDMHVEIMIPILIANPTYLLIRNGNSQHCCSKTDRIISPEQCVSFLCWATQWGLFRIVCNKKNRSTVPAVKLWMVYYYKLQVLGWVEDYALCSV